MGIQRKWTRPPLPKGRFAYRVFTDAHLFSKYCDNPSLYEKIRMAPNDGTTILLGDIVDRACCKKEDLDEATKFMEILQNRFGERYILGNHERAGVNILVYIVTLPDGRRAGFTHNDLFVNFKKWRAYRDKPPGAGLLKRFSVMFLDTLDWVKAKRPIPEEYFENVLEFMHEKGIDVMIGGHLHVEDQRFYDCEYKGISREIFVLPAHQENIVWI